MTARTGKPKITIIGAGGWTFPLVLIRDLLSFPALQGSEFCLYDIDAEAAERTRAYAQELIGFYELAATTSVPTDRREALSGSDFVICTFAVGGQEAYQHDIFIPQKYGVDQIIGDTLGPGGAFLGMRTVAVLREMAAEMRELCPRALFLQYANPMSINCWAMNALGVRCIGLCHSVQHTSAMLAYELDVPYDEVVYDCAGVNHTAWFTTFRHGEEDLVPVIYETMIDRHLAPGAPGGRTKDVYEGENEKVRAELMRLTGYFHTESSHHASEYWAWFRRTPELADSYLGHHKWFNPDIWESHDIDDKKDEIIEEAKATGLQPSEEYGAFIVDSVVSGEPRVIYGNVPNAGLISNLPADSLVEVACHVDAQGVRPIAYGELPPACAALNLVQVNVQRLAVRAALTGDRRALQTAVALDPLTGATLSLPEIREMVDEMIEAELQWLPQFENSRSETNKYD
jgi:alpha-galactosidase